MGIRAGFCVAFGTAFGLGCLVVSGTGLNSAAARSACYAGAALLAFLAFQISSRTYRLYLRRVENETQQVESMAALHVRTIEALALAIDAKHQTTREHLDRMLVYSREIGREMGLGRDELDALQTAALLHDVGHLAVPEQIMIKPGKLTPEEFEKVKIHPIVGAQILEQVGFPYPVVPIVRAHHERWDGTGYPYGLKGEEIPIGARILYAVDALQAIASDRPYQRALPLREAVAYLVRKAGTEFDPRVVEVIHRRYEDLERLAQLRNHTAGTVQVPPIKVSTAAGAPRPKGDCGFVASIASARWEAQTLWQLSHDLGSSLSLHETLTLFCARLRPLVHFDSVAFYVRRGETLLCEYSEGSNADIFSRLEIPVGEGPSGWVAQSGKALINASPALEPGYTTSQSSADSVLRSALAIPLGSANDDMRGVLTLYRTEQDGFTQNDQRVLLAINSKVGICIENALKFQQVEDSATTDYLTGLPNTRALFLHLEREIARCKRIKTPLAVMVCDLNGFKQVNDRFGHLEGNRILKEFAGVLREVCREYDYVARMGGDEFVIIAPGMEREAAHKRAVTLNRRVEEIGERICGDRLLSISVGSSFHNEDGTSAEQLLQEADRRMYSLKEEYYAQLEASGPHEEELPPKQAVP